MSQHELWRDEVQSWLLARDSVSPLDLLLRQKYEGHPALWQLLLMPLTRVFAAPVAMQCLHLLIATATVYVFARWSPFSRLQKVLFSFGYFPFYEYAIVSRSYGLSVLLLMAFCCLYPNRHRHFLLIAVILVLLCHTHALALILALVLFAALCLERITGATGPGQLCTPARAFFVGCGLIVAGVSTAVIQIRPPADTGIAVGWNFNLEYYALRGTGKALVGAYLPIPRIGLNYWNNPLCADSRFFPLSVICYGAVTAYVLFVFAGLRRVQSAWMVFGAGTIGLLTFFYTKYPGAARHHGLLFICLVVAAWMYHRSAAAPARGSAGDRRARWPRLFSLSLTVLFGVHVVAAALAAGLEIRHAFSGSRALTDYLRHHGHNDSLLVGYPDNVASALLGSSVQRQIYYPQSQRWGSYIIWNQKRLTPVSDQELIDSARALPRGPAQPVLLVLNRRLERDLILANRLTELGAFADAVVPDENYHLYQLE